MIRTRQVGKDCHKIFYSTDQLSASKTLFCFPTQATIALGFGTSLCAHICVCLCVNDLRFFSCIRFTVLLNPSFKT